jgi:glutamate-1-semialdehyde 2,1-aminomutase
MPSILIRPKWHARNRPLVTGTSGSTPAVQANPSAVGELRVSTLVEIILGQAGTDLTLKHAFCCLVFCESRELDLSVNLDRVADLKRREDALFSAAHAKSQAALERGRRSMPHGVPMSWMTELYDHPPMFVAEADGIQFTDIDGNRYRDFSLGITAAFCGHNPAPTVTAAARQLAKGSVLQLPTEDAIWVAEELRRRYRQPKWQFTVTASQANSELLLLSRLATGRKKILVFEGKYHGHVAPLLALDDRGASVPEYRGIQPEEVKHTAVVRFNDLVAVEQVLRQQNVALILSEPAMTNLGLIKPVAGFHDGLRSLAREYDAILAIDETQTQACSYGGLSRLWDLSSDAFVIGKSMAGGVPLAAYGMSERLAAEIERSAHPDYLASGPIDQPALGGTMFANAVSMAACRANLGEVMTIAAYERATSLAATLASGLQAVIDNRRLPWSICQIGTRVWCCYSTVLPENADEVRGCDIPALRDLQRVYLANRGIWDFGTWAGPIVGLPASEGDIDAYLGAWSELLREVCN